MPITNYTELQTAIGNWLRRGDLSARIPEFIRLAEAKINRKIRLREAEQLSYADYDPADNSRFLALPANYKELLDLEIKISTDDDIKYRDVKFIVPKSMDTKYNESAGKPEWYTLRDQFEFNRLPDVIYKIRIHYLKRKWDLASDTTNWLLTNHPDIYLNGSLAEGFRYLKDFASAQYWEGRFDEYLEESDLEDHASRNDGELQFDDALNSGYSGRYNIDYDN